MNSPLNFSTKLLTGQATASPKGQIVLPKLPFEKSIKKIQCFRNDIVFRKVNFPKESMNCKKNLWIILMRNPIQI